MLKQFVDQLRKDLDEPIKENEDGSFSLHLEPDLHISLRENSDSGISLFSVLAPFPEQKREEFLRKAMIANLFGRETGGSILGLNRDGTKVTFLAFLPAETIYRDFHETLEDFVNYADAWKTETTEFNQGIG